MSEKSNNRAECQKLYRAYTISSETNQRSNNEDSFQILQILPGIGTSPVTILAVADGMGGHAYGEEVSREALRKVSLALFEQLTVEPSLNSFEERPLISDQSLSQALMNALKQANAHVQRMVNVNKWGNAGSTIVVAAILDNTAVVAYLGDSPLFHYQTSSRNLVKVTEDHTVTGVLLKAGMIAPEMARYHEGRSRLEFYVGCPNLPREDPVKPVELKTGDLLLLCSDGVSGSLDSEQICKILSESGGNLTLAANYLLRKSQEAGETDNQTLILWRHEGAIAPIATSDTPLETDQATLKCDRHQQENQQPVELSSQQQQESTASDAGTVLENQQSTALTRNSAITSWKPQEEKETAFKTVVQNSSLEETSLDSSLENQVG